MSESSNFFVGKYNFSRRVINHRVPIDFNHGITQNPFDFVWRSSFRNLLVSNLIRNMSMWYCGAAFVIGIAINEFQNYRRQGHAFTTPKTQPYLNYVTNSRNKHANLGRWNGNFACWENEPLCGRDFE
ncbi:unnamed protein product (macronuclear) [Paramecium tetraurelia]|uniref:Uncharacterized protein n=1 Tax=Paramecium tetraurelia TaxID=5888 RepID=A0EC65_PARTE|nr:uncharacterized protein GSPATT00025618001 [Paramecium tetraurelia]CAK92882.1 unnamed protein product [Paramecium tetraurelia]|eukprot:XP_001460279.1 hypothetical protein (macronuclear) [Paramecium tetraurelia strain d4-2]